MHLYDQPAAAALPFRLPATPFISHSSLTVEHTRYNALIRSPTVIVTMIFRSDQYLEKHV